MEYITLGQAFEHVAKSNSYWLWVLLSFIPLGIYIYLAAKRKVESLDLRLLFLFLGLIVVAIFFRPSEIAANTTKEQAARGVYIGY